MRTPTPQEPMPSCWTRTFLFLALATFGGLAFAAAVFAQDPVFRSETHVVEVAIIAKDAGRLPIADLQKSDLRLLDNGAPQTILTLEKLTSSAAPTAEPTPPGETPAEGTQARPPARARLTVILLDGLNTENKDQMVGSQQISQMLRELPQRNDAIALYTLGDRLQVLHNFTTDYDLLRAALANHYGEKPLIGKEAPPSIAGPMTLGRGQVAFPEPDKQEEQRQSLTSGAFREIARRLAGISGEKSLIWVTAGFLPPRTPSYFYAALGELAAAKIRVYPIDARGLIACPPPLCAPALLTIDSMEEVGRQTGGHAFHDTNALAAAARLALDDSRVGYVLTYVPSSYRRDGSWHKIELRSARPGVDLRYRPSYVAESAGK